MSSLPAWYWPWVRWYLGEGEFKGDPKNPARRPADAPKRIQLWAWAKLVAFLARRKPAPVPVDPMAFWRRMSFWVTRIDHFPPVYAQQYGAGQYKIAIVPCLRGTQPEAWTSNLAQYVKDLQALGFSVVGSQWGNAGTTEQIQAEADAAAVAVDTFGFDGWVMNGEKIYEGGDKSATYARRFRQLKPDLPFGWSPEVRLSLNHDVLQELNVCYMPQAYPLENPIATLAYAAEWALNFGYDLKNCHPLIQAYLSPAGERYPAVSYRDQARALGFPSLCLYTANQTVDVPEYWGQLVV